MDRCIMLDCLPQTDKVEKITKLLSNLLSKIGTITKIQYDTKGFMFCQFETPQQANSAVKKVDNYALDKNHTLKVNLLSDIELAKDPVKPIDPSSLPDDEEEELSTESEPLNSWMFDGRDQYAIVKNDTTEVYWFKNSLIESRPKWSESSVQWSPLGNYLVSVHQKGIILSGDKVFVKLYHFTHPGVKLFDISPCEKYLTTWSPHPHPESGHNLFVWDVESSTRIKSYNIDASIIAQASTQNIGTLAQPVQFPWPILHFSPCSKYCARQTAAGITLYMLPSMQFQKIKIDNILEWSFSPSTPSLLMYTQQSEGDVPTRTTILSLSNAPEAGQQWTTNTKTRSIFNVASIQTTWHPKTKYMLQYISRKKTKTTFTSTIEIHRLQEKTAPVDVLEAQNDVSDVKFSYDNDKIALIGSNELRIYALVKNLFVLKDTFASRCQKLAFSCTGFLAAWSSTQLEFYDHGLLRQLEGNGNVTWDERGRFAVSVTSYPTPDSGFIVYDCTGAILHKQSIPLFKQFVWRPRGGDLLTLEEKAQVEGNRNVWSGQFESEDRRRGKGEGEEREKGRKEVWKKWVDFRKAAIEQGYVQVKVPESWSIPKCTVENAVME